MAVPPDYGPLLRALAQAEGDLAANAPLPPPPVITAADALAAADAVQAKAMAVSNWLIAHPGVYWAARRVLTALTGMRFAWAVDALAALKAGPGVLATIIIWEPRVRSFLSAIQPAPRGGPPITEGGTTYDPSAADNPSGAIGGPWPTPDP